MMDVWEAALELFEIEFAKIVDRCKTMGYCGMRGDSCLDLGDVFFITNEFYKERWIVIRFARNKASISGTGMWYRHESFEYANPHFADKLVDCITKIITCSSDVDGYRWTLKKLH